MSARIRIGFIPLVDCAPLVVAQEKGFFVRHGLEVELNKVQSWNQVLERLVREEFEAAHMLLTMPLKWALDRGGSELVTYAFAISQHGNAITVSNKLWRAGARDAASIAGYLRTRPDAPLRMAVVHPHSTHEYMVRLWMEQAGVDTEHEIAWRYVPPPQMVNELREGGIDGFAVGEPWGQRAAASKLGYIVASSRDILPAMNEKVLGVRARWHREHPDLHAAVLRALWEAADWLSRPENLDEAAAMVAGKRYVNTLHGAVRAALAGELHAGGHRVLKPEGFLRFAGHGANYPDPNHARFYLERMWRAGHVSGAQMQALDLQAVCLDDFYRKVLAGSGLESEGRLPENPEESYPGFLERFPGPA